jgi:Mg-chelatase subunit ChlD
VSTASVTSWLPLLGRLGVAILLGLALWNPGWRSTLSPVNAVVVLDESASMGADRLAASWKAATSVLTGLPPGSRYSLVRFGAEATLEAADRPIEELDGQPARPHKAALDTTGTDIEAAFRLAVPQLAGATPALLLLITDGGETAGEAASVLARFPAMGVPAPFLLLEVPAASGPDAAIVALDAPSQVPFGAEVETVLDLSGTRDGSANVQVRQASRLAATIAVDLVEDQVSRVGVPLVFDSPGFHELEFAASMPGDSNPANDRRRTIVNVAGPTPVLFVTAKPAAAFAESLLAGGWNLNIVRPEHAARILPQLPSPATVVLDDVAIEDMPETVWLALTELVRTRGTGLIVLGGRRSFGAGGYLNSTLEGALPVTSEAGTPMSPAAVLFVVDKSGSMGRGPRDGTPFNLAKAAVLAAAGLLGERDQSGIVAFDIDPETWLPLADRDDPSASAMNAWRDAPSGGTRIAPALMAAAEQLGEAGVEQRLLLLITDGFAVEDEYSEVLAKIDEHEIDVIALAIGDEPAIDVLEELTSRNDGLLLRVSDVAMLPHLVSETVGARRLTYDSGDTRPQQERQLPFMAGTDTIWPDLSGYMVTKERLNARVYLRSERGDPLLADHDFGIGRVVVLPGGLGAYAPDWLAWSAWGPFTGGLVEWASNRFENDRVDVRIHQERGRPQLEIDALSSLGDWETTDTARVRVSDPFGRVSNLTAEATAPGKYQIELPLRHTGRHRAIVQVGGVSKLHDFIYEAPAELRAGATAEQTLTEWLAKELVRPWPAGDSIQTPGAVTTHPTRPLFIALAALLYLGTLLSKHTGIFKIRRNPRVANHEWFS